jgi:hypothetical protein
MTDQLKVRAKNYFSKDDLKNNVLHCVKIMQITLLFIFKGLGGIYPCCLYDAVAYRNSRNSKSKSKTGDETDRSGIYFVIEILQPLGCNKIN